MATCSLPGLSPAPLFGLPVCTHAFEPKTVDASAKSPLGILNIVFGLVTAIYMLYRQYYSGGIVFLIFVAFWVFAFIVSFPPVYGSVTAYMKQTWIPRIPFSALMLKTAVDVSRTYGHVFLVSFLAGILATAFAAYYSVTFVAVYAKYSPEGGNPACSTGGGGCSTGKVTGLLVFITFAAYVSYSYRSSCSVVRTQNEDLYDNIAL